MKKVLAIAGALALTFATGAIAQNNEARGNSANAPGQDRVCLLTFNDADNVAAGANADIVQAQWLPRRAAEQQASQHPERVIGSEQYGPQWDEALCQQFSGGNPG